jgi:hypothetical protein
VPGEAEEKKREKECFCDEEETRKQMLEDIGELKST